MLFKKTSGFTLIEILVTISIIGILTTVVLARVTTARSKARDAQRIGDIKQLDGAITVYFSDCYSYPISLANLNGTALCPAYKPALLSIPVDPISKAQYPYYTDNPATGSGKRYHLCATLENNVGTNRGNAGAYPLDQSDKCNGRYLNTFDLVGGAM